VIQHLPNQHKAKSTIPSADKKKRRRRKRKSLTITFYSLSLHKVTFFQWGSRENNLTNITLARWVRLTSREIGHGDSMNS
jgi:hypothetical protein